MKRAIIAAFLFVQGCAPLQPQRSWADICAQDYNFPHGSSENRQCVFQLAEGRRDMALRYFLGVPR